MSSKTRILVYGYGNPGRQDDGLGIEMTSMIQEWINRHHLGCMTSESNYQLKSFQYAHQKIPNSM